MMHATIRLSGDNMEAIALAAETIASMLDDAADGTYIRTVEEMQGEYFDGRVNATYKLESLIDEPVMRWQVNIDGVDVAQFATLDEASTYLTEHHTDGVTNAYLASMTESN